MHAEMIRRAAAYGLVKDYLDNNMDVGDGGDGFVPIKGEGSRLLLCRCNYDNE